MFRKTSLIALLSLGTALAFSFDAAVSDSFAKSVKPASTKSVKAKSIKPTKSAKPVKSGKLLKPAKPPKSMKPLTSPKSMAARPFKPMTGPRKGLATMPPLKPKAAGLGTGPSVGAKNIVPVLQAKTNIVPVLQPKGAVQPRPASVATAPLIAPSPQPKTLAAPPPGFQPNPGPGTQAMPTTGPTPSAPTAAPQPRILPPQALSSQTPAPASPAPGAQATAGPAAAAGGAGTPGTVRTSQGNCVNDGASSGSGVDSCLGGTTHVTPGTPPGGANVAAATAALTPGTGATQADQARDLIAMIKQGLGLPPGASNEQLRQLLRDRLQTGGVRNAVLDDLLRFIKQRYGLSPLASNDRLMDHLFDIELGRADRLLDNISSGVDPNKSPISDALAAVNPAIVALQGKIADLERRLSKKEDELRNKRNERNDVWLARFSLPADLGAIVAMNGGSLDAYWTTSEAAIQALVNEYDNLYRQWREARYQLELAIQRDRTQ